MPRRNGRPRRADADFRGRQSRPSRGRIVRYELVHGRWFSMKAGLREAPDGLNRSTPAKRAFSKARGDSIVRHLSILPQASTRCSVLRQHGRVYLRSRGEPAERRRGDGQADFFVFYPLVDLDAGRNPVALLPGRRRLRWLRSPAPVASSALRLCFFFFFASPLAPFPLPLSAPPSCFGYGPRARPLSSGPPVSQGPTNRQAPPGPPGPCPPPPPPPPPPSPPHPPWRRAAVFVSARRLPDSPAERLLVFRPRRAQAAQATRPGLTLVRPSTPMMPWSASPVCSEGGGRACAGSGRGGTDQPKRLRA